MTDSPFIPYGRQQIDQDDIDAVTRALQSDYLTTGPEITAFEDELRQYTGAKYAVAVANGTAALHLAVLALDLPPGSVGVTSPNTFVATSNALLYGGHRPQFVDIDPDTYVMSPAALKAVLANSRVDVVLPVHFAGNTAGIEEISRLVREHGARIIEDAAHSIGGRYRDGSPVGSCRYSDMTVFSFHPVKTMTTGEGGAITTNDPDLYRRLCVLRTHGITRAADQLEQNPGPWYYEMQMLGYNYRITDVQAALGRSQLTKLDRFVARRQELVSRYNQAFADISWLTAPAADAERHTGWHLYVAQFDWEAIGMDRPSVMASLKEQGIGTQVLYIPVPDQPYYRGLGIEAHIPNARRYYDHALALPLYPSLSNSDQDRVISAVRALA